MPSDTLADLKTFQQALNTDASLKSALQECLNHTEIAAVGHRAEDLISIGKLPAPDPNRRVYPWPAI
jgi:hypothetical protein